LFESDAHPPAPVVKSFGSSLYGIDSGGAIEITGVPLALACLDLGLREEVPDIEVGGVVLDLEDFVPSDDSSTVSNQHSFRYTKDRVTHMTISYPASLYSP
jgi:hypothetical protein